MHHPLNAHRKELPAADSTCECKKELAKEASSKSDIFQTVNILKK